MQCEVEAIDISEIEKQKTAVAARLSEKESETLDVLKELEHTNMLAGELNSRLQKKQSEHVTCLKIDAVDINVLSVDEVISIELNQEKMKKLSVMEASIESFKQSITNERIALEATRQRPASKSSNISFLEKEITQTRKKLEREADESGVSLSLEEYEALVARAREAEHSSNERVQKAIQEVNEANKSKIEMLIKVEKATEEVKLTKLVMENALSRLETATTEKLAVEESLRQRRSNHSKKTRAYSNLTKVKTVGPSQYRKDLSLHDVNRPCLVSDSSVTVSRPHLSIGQILNTKLQMQQVDQSESAMGFANGALKRHESLGQILGRRDENSKSNITKAGKAEKGTEPELKRGKSNRFAFARFSLQLGTQSKKKKAASAPRFMMCKGEA